MDYIRKIVWLIIFVAILTSTGFAADNDNPQTQPESLSLDNCLAIALKNSSDMKAADQKVTIAEQQLRQAQSGLWPTLGYEIVGVDMEQNQLGLMLGGLAQSQFGLILNEIDFDKLSLADITLTQPLYTGGQITQGIKLAKLNLETAKEDQRKTKQTLIFNVKSAYYQVWLAQQLVKVAEDSYENMGRHEERVQSFYEVGQASKFDLLRAQVEHEKLKPTVIKAQNAVILSKLSLANIIGIEKSRNYRADYDLSKLQLPKKVDLDAGSLVEQAYQQRSELRKLRELQEMAKAEIAIANAGYKPTVALVGSYGASSVGEYYPKNWDENKSWTLMFDIKGNFFDGFKTPAKVGEAKANQKLVEINEKSLRDGIDLDVEQSLQGLKESLETSFANQANMNLAKESLEMTEAKFEARMATTMDVRDSQLALDQALDGYYEGVAAYLTALAKVDLAVGKD